MPALSTWNLDQTRLLTRRELSAVLADLAPRSACSPNVHRNLVIVRLACCCGLRVSEIANLQLDDVVADVTRPHLRLRRGTSQWIDTHGSNVMLLALHVPRSCQAAAVTVHVVQRSSEREAVVEFGLDPRAPGRGVLYRLTL
jgi:hypothetical protein